MPYRSLKLLVVDDFATMARIMKVLAQRIGFNDVDICHDGETALCMMRVRAHDVVLCDIKMQPMDGVELVRRLRAEPYGKDCVIVLTTADREVADAVKGAGILRLVDGLILKPFNSDDFHTALSDIAARRGRLGHESRIGPGPAPIR